MKTVYSETLFERKIILILRIFTIIFFAATYIYTTYLRAYLNSEIVTFNSEQVRLRYDTIDQMLKDGFELTDDEYIPILDEKLHPATYLSMVSLDRMFEGIKLNTDDTYIVKPHVKTHYYGGGISLTKGDTIIVVVVCNDRFKKDRLIRNCPIYTITWYAKDTPEHTCSIDLNQFNSKMDIPAIREVLSGHTERKLDGYTYFFSNKAQRDYKIELTQNHLLSSVEVGGMPREIQTTMADTASFYAWILLFIVVIQWVGEVYGKWRSKHPKNYKVT